MVMYRFGRPSLIKEPCSNINFPILAMELPRENTAFHFLNNIRTYSHYVSAFTKSVLRALCSSLFNLFKIIQTKANISAISRCARLLYLCIQNLISVALLYGIQ